KFAPVGVVDHEERVGVRLQVVNLVLEPSAEHLEGYRLPGLGLELIEINVLRGLDATADHAGDLDVIGLGERIIVTAFLDNRIITDDQLTDAGNAEGGSEAELMNTKPCISRNYELELDGARRRLTRWLGPPAPASAGRR